MAMSSMFARLRGTARSWSMGRSGHRFASNAARFCSPAAPVRQCRSSASRFLSSADGKTPAHARPRELRSLFRRSRSWRRWSALLFALLPAMPRCRSSSAMVLDASASARRLMSVRWVRPVRVKGVGVLVEAHPAWLVTREGRGIPRNAASASRRESSGLGLAASAAARP